MNDFLERIQLIRYKKIKLAIDKSEFMNRFKQHVDEGSIGAFSSAFEAFTSSKNRYKGTITQNTFEMRRRREFFDRSSYLASVKGTFRQQNEHVVVDAQINGFNNALIPIFIILCLFYIMFFIVSLTSFKESIVPIFFILLHGVLMFSIPYFIIRKRVKNTAIDLEKELFFMMKKESY